MDTRQRTAVILIQRPSHPECQSGYQQPVTNPQWIATDLHGLVCDTIGFCGPSHNLVPVVTANTI